LGLSAIWIVRYTATGLGPPSPDEAELISSVLWEHAGGSRQVEHITVTATENEIDLTMFLCHAVADPGRTAQAVLDRACAAAPILRRWIYLPVRFAPPRDPEP
jgi:hypothetical protein